MMKGVDISTGKVLVNRQREILGYDFTKGDEVVGN